MQTHCKRGHEFTIETTYTTPSTGKRYCKICKRMKAFEDIDVKRAKDRIRVAQWRADNKEHDNRLWTARRKEKKAWIDDYKKGKKCISCPESDPVCLDFHHRDPKQKSFLISLGVARASLERIQQEVAKCDLLCANCHRKLHAAERAKDTTSL